MKSVLVIGGPTSSGKTALSIKLAKRIDAEIISLDAVQIYEGLVIGSGAVSKSEQNGIPHHLIGILSPKDPIDAAKVRELCLLKIQEIEKRVIISAGSTMYLSILIHGIADIPTSSKELREKYRNMNSSELWDELNAVDTVAAESLSKSDRQRIERALEVKILTGESIRTFQKKHQFPKPDIAFHLISLWWNRQELYRRIEVRCKQMISNGLVEEIKGLIDTFGSNAPALNSIGYKEYKRFLNGEITNTEAEDGMIQATKNYAKRQMTFWKNEPLKRGWSISPSEGDLGGVMIGDEVPLQRGPKPKGVYAWNWDFDQLCCEIAKINSVPGVSLWNLSAVTLL